jgi:DNA-binding PadR family transcriptional regulator
MLIMDISTLEELLPLTPAVFHILLVLAAGDAHGYAIMLEADRLTGGRLRLGPGTLYRSLYKMVLDGLVEEVKEEVGSGDERRVTYRITRRGWRLARAEARRLDALVRVARRRRLLDDRSEPGAGRGRRGARA